MTPDASCFTVMHIFELKGKIPYRQQDTLFALPDMYSVHQERADTLGIRVRRLTDLPIQCTVRRDWDDERKGRQTGDTETIPCSMTLVLARDGLIQMHLQTEHESADSLYLFLGLLCHQRSTIQLTGGGVAARDFVPLVEFLREVTGNAHLSLGADVHQLVHVPTVPSVSGVQVQLVAHDGAATPFGRSLIYRARPFEVDKGFRDMSAGFFIPAQLNRLRGTSCLGGRGVSAIQNSRSQWTALTFVVTTQLFALARLRGIRTDLDSIVASVGPSLDRRTSSIWLDGVSKLSERLRLTRLEIANNVTALTDGLALPESLIDEFRVRLGEFVGIPSLLASTERLVQTLAVVVESVQSDVTASAAAARMAADSRWAKLVAIVSAITVPALLLLAYFGVNSTVDLSSDRSVFDFERYLLPWLVAALLLSLILFGAAWVLRVNRREAGLTHRALISAHRGGLPLGAREASADALLAAMARSARNGADFVELDVQCDDPGGVASMPPSAQSLVVRHAKDPKADAAYLELTAALSTLRGQTRAHVDLKFDASRVSESEGPARGDGVESLATTPEVIVWNACRAALGEHGFVITSRHPESIRLINAWRRKDDQPGEGLLGLSLGHACEEHGLYRISSRYLSALFPGRLVQRTGADFVAAKSQLARLNVLRWGKSAGVPVLVWTVNGDKDLRRFIRDRRVWGIVTDEQEVALRLRGQAR